MELRNLLYIMELHTLKYHYFLLGGYNLSTWAPLCESVS